MSTPREQIQRAQRFWDYVGRKSRGPLHFLGNVAEAWLDHDLRLWLGRKNRGFWGRLGIRLLLTAGSLLLAYGALWLGRLLGPLLGLLLAAFWLWMDLPSIWSRALPVEEIDP